MIGNELMIEQEKQRLNEAKFFYQQDQDRITNDLNERKHKATLSGQKLDQDKFVYTKERDDKADAAVTAAHSFLAELTPAYSRGSSIEQRINNANLAFTELSRDPRFKDVPVSVMNSIKEVLDKSPTIQIPTLKETFKRTNERGEVELWGLDQYGRKKLIDTGTLDPNISTLIKDSRTKWMDYVKEAMGAVTATAGIWGKAQGSNITLGSAISGGDATKMAQEIFKLVPEMEGLARNYIKKQIGVESFPEYLDKLLTTTVKDKKKRSELVQEFTGIDPSAVKIPGPSREQLEKSFKGILDEMLTKGIPVTDQTFQALMTEARNSYWSDSMSYANALHALEGLAPNYVGIAPAGDYAALSKANAVTGDNTTDFSALQLLPVEPTSEWETERIIQGGKENPYTARKNALKSGDPFVQGWPETGVIQLSEAREVIQRVVKEEKTVKEVWQDIQDERLSEKEFRKRKAVMDSAGGVANLFFNAMKSQADTERGAATGAANSADSWFMNIFRTGEKPKTNRAEAR